MALITSAQSGNFNDTATWTGGVVPTVGDEARASTGHTITITANATCDEVSNAGTGIFTLNDGVTLTANVTNKSTTTSRVCLQFTAASPAIGYIIGDCTGGTVSGAEAVRNTSSGTINITGNCSGSSGATSYGALNNSTGSIVITGNATGSSGANSEGLRNASTGTVTLTGNITGGSGTNAHGASNQVGGTVTVTGDVTGGAASGVFGIANISIGSITITGNATGGTAVTTWGAQNAASGTITIIGSAIASAVAGGANNASTGTLSVVRAVGNSWGIGAAGGVGSQVGLSSAAVGSDTRAEELEYGANGQAPTSGAVRIVNKTNNKCLVDLTTSVIKTLADPSDGTGQANQSDVRSGVSYALGNRTGTCAVPAASSVAFGVAVDNTTGTAALTPAAVWNALTSGMTTAGSIGERLKNAATVGTTGQALADALTPAP